jgi:hypothetical protein
MKNIFLLIGFFLLSFFLIQCKPEKSKDSGSVELNPQKSIGYHIEQVWASDSVLLTPESVIYDPVHDAIYVSCINKDPWEKDGDGFISRLSSSGEVEDLEWIKELSGPKGMAILNNIL